MTEFWRANWQKLSKKCSRVWFLHFSSRFIIKSWAVCAMFKIKYWRILNEWILYHRKEVTTLSKNEIIKTDRNEYELELFFVRVLACTVLCMIFVRCYIPSIELFTRIKNPWIVFLTYQKLLVFCFSVFTAIALQTSFSTLKNL